MVSMHTIQPARLKPGVTRESAVAATQPSRRPRRRPSIRGKALIFWDLKVLGKKKKLDAIDTDQITPAADCVSESLDTLDERWKAGAFRYLMPDFRARVHRGETFLIAGDRFAIGSSREMSPAGLKAIAEEVGLEMVIVCGHNMGDIFRRNALNLGLQVVQSPEAVADARDGDEFSFDPQSRRLTNETQAEDLRPGAADAEGRRDPPDRRHLRGGPPRVRGVGRRRRRAIEWPDAEQARRMTSTEQIVWAHRVDKSRRGRARRDAARLRRSAAGVGRHGAVRDPHVQPDHRRRHDLPAAGGDRQRSLRLHRQGRRRQADGDRPGVRARCTASRSRTTRRRATASSISTFPSRALVDAGPVHSRRRLAQPRLRRVRRGRHGRRIDDARVRLVDRLHLLHAGEGAARRVRRPAAAVGERQGHRARAAAALGREAVAGHVGGARRRERSSCRSPIATRSRT